jgi:PAS domain S-box-containing protein
VIAINESYGPGIAFFNLGEMDLIAPSLLRAVFDKIPASIEVLKAVWEEDRVIDFEYILQNEAAKRSAGHHDRLGKKFLTTDINNTYHFQKMVEVVETGQELRTVVDAKLNGGTEWLETKYIKFGDGLILFRENESKKILSEINTRDDAHFIEQIVDTSPEIIYIMDLDTLQIIYTNRKIATELGYTKEQTDKMKNPLMDIMYKEDIVPFKKHLENIKALTSDDKVLEIEYRLINASGGITWLCDRNAVFKRNSRKRPVEKIGFSQNITDRKEQEERLLTGADILQQAEEITGMGTWEYDMATGNFKWSQGMYQLFNLPIKTKPHPEIYFEYTPEEQKDIVDRIVNNIRSNGEPFEEIITLVPENMDKKFVRIKGSPIKDKKKHIVKMVGVDLDITEHLKSAQDVAQLNKKLQERHKELETLNSELKTFNNITSSDYKDTLQLLYTNLEYIATTEARRLGDSAKANIRRAQAAIQRMKLLTSDITGYLQLYEIGVNKTLIDPNSILKDVITGMNKKILEANASIELTTLPYLHADPFLFSLLVKHLLDNAIKFRRVVPGTVIKIKYSRADEINNIPGAMADRPHTIISISDNGLGIPEDNTERVFELFFRIHGKQYPGSGIGLAICKKIMAMHQGLISAESTTGAGTTFICYFPEEVNI